MRYSEDRLKTVEIGWTLQPIFKVGNDLINKGIERKSVEIGWTLQPFSAAFQPIRNRFFIQRDEDAFHIAAFYVLARAKIYNRLNNMDSDFFRYDENFLIFFHHKLRNFCRTERLA